MGGGVVLHKVIGMSGKLTGFIVADLRARLGRETPTLTLPALAAHYGTSLTPARRAVALLVAEGVLRRGDGGRLEVARRPRAGATPAPPADTEQALTREVIAAGLRGDGPLREEVTAARLGVGRTVLRQLLHRLAGLGLVEHLPRRGWRPRPIDPAALDEYLHVRALLEAEALRLAWPRLDSTALRGMIEGNEEGRLDNRLHAYIIGQAGNRYLDDFFARHGAYYSAILDHAAPEAGVVEAMAGQHRAILRAMLAGERERAEALLIDHIRGQAPVVRGLITPGRGGP